MVDTEEKRQCLKLYAKSKQERKRTRTGDIRSWVQAPFVD